MIYLLFLFAFLMLADIWTTGQFTKYRIDEANHWLKKLMGEYGFDELYFVKYFVFVMILAAGGEGWIGIPEMVVANLIQGGVVIWNLYQIWRRRAQST